MPSAAPVRFRCVAHLWRSRPLAGRSSRVPTGRSEAGEWRHLRWLNGDQTHQGRHVRLEPGRFTLQRVKLYRYR